MRCEFRGENPAAYYLRRNAHRRYILNESFVRFGDSRHFAHADRNIISINKCISYIASALLFFLSRLFWIRFQACTFPLFFIFSSSSMLLLFTFDSIYLLDFMNDVNLFEHPTLVDWRNWCNKFLCLMKFYSCFSNNINNNNKKV